MKFQKIKKMFFHSDFGWSRRGGHKTRAYILAISREGHFVFKNPSSCLFSYTRFFSRFCFYSSVSVLNICKITHVTYEMIVTNSTSFSCSYWRMEGPDLEIFFFCLSVFIYPMRICSFTIGFPHQKNKPNLSTNNVAEHKTFHKIFPHVKSQIAQFSEYR